MPIRFTFLLLFSLFSLLYSREKVHLGFEVLEGRDNYRNILQKKSDELNKKGFDCRIVTLGERLFLFCNEVSDMKDLAPTIAKFRKEKVAYTLINLDDGPQQKSIGRQIPLYIGYHAYEQKNYKKALNIFRANYIEKKSSEHAEAYALALIKIGNYQEAIKVLAPYSNDPKVAGLYQESIVSYVDLFIQKGDFDAAEKLIQQSRLSPDQRSILDSKLAYLHAIELNRQKKYADSSSLILSMSSSDPKGKELLIGNQMALASKALEAKKYTEALGILEPYRKESKDVAEFSQKILYYSYLERGWEILDKDPKKALNYFKKCSKIENSNACKEGQMYSYHRLHNSEQAILLARELYSIKPDDKYLKILIADYLQEKNSSMAAEYYRLLKNKLGTKNPQNVQTTTLVYNYIKAGDLKKSREMIKKIEDPKSRKELYRHIARLQKGRAMNTLIGYSQSKAYAQCYTYAQKMRMKYQDINIDRIGGWCAYHVGRYGVAQAFFEHAVDLEHQKEVDDLYALALSAHKADNDEWADEVLGQITEFRGYTGQIASLYNDMGQSRRAKEILVEMKEALERDEEIRKVNKMTKVPNPITQVAGGLSYYRNKGTEGKDYLEVVSLPVDIDYLSPNGYYLYGEFDVLHLSNGFLGSEDYHTFGFGLTDPYQVSHADSFEGSIGFRSKFIDLEIGFTPIGLNLPAQWTGRLSSHYSWGKWDIHGLLVQEGIGQSFLSRVGQSTYLNGQRYDWGRVLKQGAAIGLSHDGDMTYTLDLFYYPRIYGENVIDNSEAKAVVTAIHHTATVDYAFLDFGMVIVYDTFDTNSDLFTYGHGGYFSPQSFWLGSMVLDVGDYIGEDTYYRFLGALGYQSYKVEDIELFPLAPNPLYPLTVEGYNESGVTFRAALQVGHAINKNFDLLAGVSWNKVYGYDQLHVGVAISYHFDGQREASLKRLRDAHSIDQLIP